MPNTPMRAVCPPKSEVGGVGDCEMVVRAWGGGALDTKRNRLILWGGGHNDYWGNELYAFEVATGTWKRLTDPSKGTVTNQDPLPDGNPVSRHTYDGIDYVHHADVLFAQGGSRASDGGGTDVTWTFDFVTSAWTNHAPDPKGPGGYCIATAYDPNSKSIFARSTKNLYIYDLESNVWTPLVGFGYTPLWPRYERWGDKTGTVDPKRHLFWSVGNGDILVWSIDEKKLVTEDWVTTGGGDYSNAGYVKGYPEQLFESGGGAVYNVDAPGFDYDVQADALVGWPNAGSPYVLDLTTKIWEKGSDQGAPTSKTSGGTYGRFRYIPAYNVFILVVSVDKNVFFYKNRGC